MKKSIYIFALLLILLLGACSPAVEEIQTEEVPTEEVPTEEVQPTETPLPEPAATEEPLAAVPDVISDQLPVAAFEPVAQFDCNDVEQNGEFTFDRGMGDFMRCGPVFHAGQAVWMKMRTNAAFDDSHSFEWWFMEKVDDGMFYNGGVELGFNFATNEILNINGIQSASESIDIHADTEYNLVLALDMQGSVTFIAFETGSQDAFVLATGADYFYPLNENDEPVLGYSSLRPQGDGQFTIYDIYLLTLE